jgi:DDE superfamily endonuclease
MLPLPEVIILVLAPFAPLFSQRVWRHAQVLLLGAMLAPGARTVTAALRVMGLSCERHFTNYRRVLNRASWSLCQAGRILCGRRRHKTSIDWVRQSARMVSRMARSRLSVVG